MTNRNNDYLLEMNHITKSFPGVKALGDASLHVRAGETHALVGENGAGKSTLMNVLLGSITPNSGEIIYCGNPVSFRSPHEALINGISMVHQELSLIPSVSVAENIWIGRESEFSNFGFINEKKRVQRTQELFDKYHIDIDPKAITKTLSIANLQMVEISRAISYSPKILIMDEPTSSLSEKEIRVLYQIIHDLTKEGTAIIFISHKLDEILTLCDRITVLRDGYFINEFSASEISNHELIKQIAGREINDLYPKISCEIGDVVLDVHDITHRGQFENINFFVRAGEVLGCFGLVGAGRTETMEGVFGIRSLQNGQIFIGGEKVTIKSPQKAISYGLAMVTEDRRISGILGRLSVKHNISLANLAEISFHGFWIKSKKENTDIKNWSEKLAIKTPSVKQPVGSLSGGNQQKVILARWLYTKPRVLILDEPTKGIDVGSKSEIHRMISDLARQGIAIILISSECDEVMRISDRIIVFHKGKIVNEVQRADFDKGSLIENAFGIVDFDGSQTADDSVITKDKRI